jgi:hypothetical protein
MTVTASRKKIHPGIVNLLMLLVLAPIGCSGVRDSDRREANSPEPSLAEQVQAVREGQSSQIRLDHMLVADRDLELLSGLESRLLRINFSRTEITDVGLERLSHMERLEQLRLASGRTTDAGMACLGKLEQLRFLHLIDMPITDAGLDHLHALKSLESLYLDGTRVTDAGIERLVAAMPKVHLHIDDHHHRLDPHGADHSH